LVVRAGTSKSGLHKNSAGCGAAEVYASDPGSEEEELTLRKANINPNQQNTNLT
jgi:hypothetical protein